MIFTAIKFLFKFILSKYGAIVLVAAIIGYGEYKLFDAGVQHGAIKATSEYVKKELKFNKQIEQLSGQVNECDKFKKDINDSTEKMRLKQNQIVLDLQGKLAAMTAEKLKVKTIVEQVTKYVPAEADAKCVVPYGFIRLYNDSIQTSTVP